MDDVLYATDRFLLEPYLYSFIDSPLVQEPTLPRNIFGVWFILSIGGILMYISFAALSYLFIFDKSAEKDPLVPYPPTFSILHFLFFLFLFILIFIE